MFKIANWNVNSLKVRLNHLLQWLDEHQPDIMAIQECKTIDERFPRTEIEAAGYNVIYYGQKTYNGVAILSKKNHADPQTIIKNIPCFADTQARVLTASYSQLRVINVYVPNGQSVGSEKYQYKLEWLAGLREFVTEEMKQHQNVVILGDFNIAPSDQDVHDPAAWAGHVLVSPLERAAFEDLLALGLQDSFRIFNKEAGCYTWWDYRAAAFRRNLGLRIDHILTSKSLAQKCSSCYIDIQPRRWEQPSDHTIIVAEFEWGS